MKPILRTLVVGLSVLLGLGGCAQTQKIPLTSAMMLNTFPPLFASEGPVARSSTNYRLVSAGEVIELDASPSLPHGDGETLSYRWTIVAAPAESQSRLSTAERPQTSLLIDSEGTYRLQLEVTDSQSRRDQLNLTLSTDSAQLPRVSFVALGDQGKGSAGQYRVAEAIERVCADRGCDFALGLGDNIYPAGVSDVNDVQFLTKFEQPYASLALPFYMVLGNHDTSGITAGDGGFNPRGDIQIAYARSADKPSLRWQMPARYYRIPAPVAQTQRTPLVDLYAIDTTLLMSPYDDLTKYGVDASYEQQQRWLDNEKRNSRAQWQLALAHHPYLSNARHGNAGSYDHLYLFADQGTLPERVSGRMVQRFYEENLCRDMDLVLSGHDHALQYLKPVEPCGKTAFIVSGAGAGYQGGIDDARNASYWQAGDALGFFHIEILAQTMTVTAYTVNEEEGTATERYRRTVVK